MVLTVNKRQKKSENSDKYWNILEFHYFLLEFWEKITGNYWKLLEKNQ